MTEGLIGPQRVSGGDWGEIVNHWEHVLERGPGTPFSQVLPVCLDFTSVRELEKKKAVAGTVLLVPKL